MSEWIAVSDRLPKERTYALVWDGEHVGMDCCDDPRGAIGRLGFDPSATHWMELPEPPK